MFSRFFEGNEEVEQLADQFATAFVPQTVSMAQLQAFFMNYKGDPKGALRDAPALFAPCTRKLQDSN